MLLYKIENWFRNYYKNFTIYVIIKGRDSDPTSQGNDNYNYNDNDNDKCKCR